MARGRPVDPKRRRRGTGHHPAGGEVALRVVDGDAADLPRPPGGLPVEAHDLWRLVVGELWPRGLRPSDLEGVRMLVMAAHRNRQAAAAVDEHGLMVLSGTGSLMLNPALRLEKDTRVDYLRWSDALGLTMASRLRLGLMQLAGESLLSSLARDLDSQT